MTVKIVGVGCTGFSKRSERSTTSLASEAIALAAADAGLPLAEIDGISTFSLGDSTNPSVLASSLGLQRLNYHAHEYGGGAISAGVVHNAAKACEDGIARHVVCYRALNGRSGRRFGGSGSSVEANGVSQFLAPYGVIAPAHRFGVAASAHMLKYGTTQEHLAKVAIEQRKYAIQNDRALMRSALDLDIYFSSPWIAEPFRLYDCCLESDGACAVLLSSDPALTGGPRAVTVLDGGVERCDFVWDASSDCTITGGAALGKKLYERCGVSASDIDVAILYDNFTSNVILLLEDYGFCGKGEGGPFVEDGGIGLDGPTPTNTHGGLLSEAYVHGLNGIIEAVAQLRGEAGARQVHGAELALCAAEGGLVAGVTSAIVLSRD